MPPTLPPILDDFNRPDGDLLPSPNWTQLPSVSTTPLIVSNEINDIANYLTANEGAYWNDPFGSTQDVAAYITSYIVPAGPDFLISAYLGSRYNGTGFEGYWAGMFDPSGANQQQLVLFFGDSGTPFAGVVGLTVVPFTVQGIWVHAEYNQFEVFAYNGSSWISQFTGTDGTYFPSSSYLGFLDVLSTATVDDFRGAGSSPSVGKMGNIQVGYLDLLDVPNFDGTAFLNVMSCTPKGGIWINADVTGADNTSQDFGFSNVARLSGGVVDSDGTDYVATYRSKTDVIYEEGSSHVTGGLTGNDAGPGAGGFTELYTIGVGGPGWKVQKSGVYNSPTDGRAFYMALEGDTMETAAGTFDIHTTGTDETVSGLPFEPDFVLVFGSNGGNGGGVFNVGAIDRDGNQWSIAFASSYIQVLPGPTWTHQSKGDCLLLGPTLGTGFAGNDTPWELTGAITSDGFVATYVTNPLGTRGYTYLAVHDPLGEFKVGFDNLGQSQFGMTKSPQAVFCATTWSADQSQHDNGGISLGYMGGAVAIGQGTHSDATLPASIYTEVAAGPTRWSSNSSQHSLLRTDVGGSVIDYCDITLHAGGFTPTATTSDLFGYIMMRGSKQAGCPVPGGFIPQIYRMILPA